MEIEMVTHYCENCQKETLQEVTESAFEIEYVCKECGSTEQSYKTFF